MSEECARLMGLLNDKELEAVALMRLEEDGRLSLKTAAEFAALRE